MNWGLTSVVFMWLVIAVTALSAAAAIFVLGHRGWNKGLGAVGAALLLIALLSLLQIQYAPTAPWQGLVLSCLLFSLALDGVLLGLRQFRRLTPHWAWMGLAPLGVLVLGNLPISDDSTLLFVLHAMAAIFFAQMVWASVELWRMRALDLGVGYRMLWLAAILFLAGTPYLQCGLGQGMTLGPPAEGPLWYGLRLLLVVSVLLLLALGFMRMVQDRREARTRRAALRDPLTRMLNRRALMRTLDRCMRTATHRAHPLALLLIDVDHFKRVNDTHGHIAGDKVLRHISRVLAAHVRTESHLGRFGGEEFVVICPDTGLDEARVLAARLILAVRSSSVRIKNLDLQVTISIGGYADAVTAESEWENLLEAADSAMYYAKSSGRDRVVMHQDLIAEPTPDNAPHGNERHA